MNIDIGTDDEHKTASLGSSADKLFYLSPQVTPVHKVSSASLVFNTEYL